MISSRLAETESHKETQPPKNVTEMESPNLNRTGQKAAETPITKENNLQQVKIFLKGPIETI